MDRGLDEFKRLSLKDYKVGQNLLVPLEKNISGVASERHSVLDEDEFRKEFDGARSVISFGAQSLGPSSTMAVNR